MIPNEFKIDLIVWKFIIMSQVKTCIFTFKIDLIVWK